MFWDLRKLSRKSVHQEVNQRRPAEQIGVSDLFCKHEFKDDEMLEKKISLFCSQRGQIKRCGGLCPLGGLTVYNLGVLLP